jgi:hypothetical protein
MERNSGEVCGTGACPVTYDRERGMAATEDAMKKITIYAES